MRACTKYLVAALVAIVIIPPMAIAAALYDIHRHWQRGAFDWPADEECDCDDCVVWGYEDEDD